MKHRHLRARRLERLTVTTEELRDRYRDFIAGRGKHR